MTIFTIEVKSKKQLKKIRRNYCYIVDPDAQVCPDSLKPVSNEGWVYINFLYCGKKKTTTTRTYRINSINDATNEMFLEPLPILHNITMTYDQLLLFNPFEANFFISLCGEFDYEVHDIIEFTLQREQRRVVAVERMDRNKKSIVYLSKL